MLSDGTPTYISLFSAGGIGCFGFKEAGYSCIATAEKDERRLAIQKFNHKCLEDSGYICGDLTDSHVQKKVLCAASSCHGEVDVVVATPPCQGISLLNKKKTSEDIHRNSLVTTAVKLVEELHPKVFVFENVRGFLDTGCIDPDTEDIVSIGNYIGRVLGNSYANASSVLNLLYYGSGSSRTRTLVLGVRRDISDFTPPDILMPWKSPAPVLRDLIGNLPDLSWGEIHPDDFYHAFHTYSDYLKPWIENTPPGHSAFDNKNPEHRPHTVSDGKYIPYAFHDMGKYTRMRFDAPAPCVHTYNMNFASQTTIHPVQHRVLSIRELMKLMSVPQDFRFLPYSLQELNSMSEDDKKSLYDKHENIIRTCLGEAVPTEVMRRIAVNIRKWVLQ